MPNPKPKPVATPSRAPTLAPQPPCQPAAPAPVKSQCGGVSAKSTPVKSPDYKKVRMEKSEPIVGVARSLEHDFQSTVKTEQQPDVSIVADMSGKPVS